MQKLLQSKLRKDVAGTFISQMVVMAVVFLVNKLLSNLLSVEEFGQYNIIKRSSSVLAFIMAGGIGITLPRYLPRLISQGHPRITRGFLWGCLIYICFNSAIVSLICYIFQPFLGDKVLGTDSYLMLTVVILYSLFNALWTCTNAYYRGVDKFRIYNFTAVCGTLMTLIPFFLWNGLTVFNLFMIWAGGYMLLNASVMFIESRKDGWLISKVRFQHIRCHIKEIYSYSLPRLVGDGFLYFYSAFPVIFVGSKMGLKEAAYYSVGIAMLTMITPFFSFMGTILLPYVSRAIAEHSFAKAQVLINKLLLLFLATSITMVVIMSFIMPFCIRLLFSAEYVGVANIARILIWGLVPQVIYLLYRNPIDAAAKFPYNTIIMGISLAILVLSFLFCNNLTQFAIAYLCVSYSKGLLSFLSWIYLKTKLKHA